MISREEYKIVDFFNFSILSVKSEKKLYSLFSCYLAELEDDIIESEENATQLIDSQDKEEILRQLRIGENELEVDMSFFLQPFEGKHVYGISKTRKQREDDFDIIYRTYKVENDVFMKGISNYFITRFSGHELHTSFYELIITFDTFNRQNSIEYFWVLDWSDGDIYKFSDIYNKYTKVADSPQSSCR